MQHKHHTKVAPNFVFMIHAIVTVFIASRYNMKYVYHLEIKKDEK